MKRELIDILRDFCLSTAPAGYEEDIARKVKGYISEYCDEVEIDELGNVIGKISGKETSLRPVLVNAHMDRIGFIVSKVLGNGFVKMEAIGSPNDKVLPGQTFLIRKSDKTEWIRAVAGTKSTHLMAEEEAQQTMPLNKTLFDLGADCADQVKDLGIRIGCPAVFEPSFYSLSNGRVCGTALDNCGSVTALVKVAKILSENRPIRDVYIAGNVWEEYNQRGSAFIARKIQPIAIISMDMLLAGDTPDVEMILDGALGSGPLVSNFNYHKGAINGCIAHPRLLELVELTSQELSIEFQHYVCEGGFGDNAYAQLEIDGPASIEMGAPVRYAHSSCEVADINDINDLGDLVAGIVLRIREDFSNRRY